jgi:predicted transcriptional regulator
MKKKIKIQLQSPRATLDEFVERAEAIAHRKGKGTPRKKKDKDDEIVLCFEDLSVFAKVFSPERLRLLRTVRDKKPASLNELAKILGRDYPNVYNDARFLAEQGILELQEKPGRGRGTIKPTFDWDGFDIAV